MTTDEADTQSIARLFRDSVIIDGCAPALMQDMRTWRRYRDGAATAILATVTTSDDLPGTIERLSGFHRLVRSNPDELMIAESVADIEQAKQDGKLALVLQFQNGRPLGRDAGMVELYQRMGVSVIQLTYNHRNNLGDGCMEPENAGLSQFGRQVVREMNRHGVLVDLSHTGERTSLDAIEHSDSPVVFSHANAKSVHNHPRNITDEQISKVAATGGLVGVCAFPAFITDKTDRPSVDDVVAHVDHVVQVAGIDHVGFGVDFFFDEGYWPNIELGNWSPGDWPEPPWHYPLDGSNALDLALKLADHGYSQADIGKVMGRNLLRVLAEVARNT
ncbi:membrane dipeptidase [Kribbella turkmenica]|uniref:Membrane dipeptidase n=1 Tax=Kribbella turkmenica TaxID=2530375 RepID=A0A4R4X8R2_9ACTN|nr:membrane dipeptidase [Kribbella turkmenica]TDD26822.1 membrane dipeptidase [Kribbella turkmenica]